MPRAAARSRPQPQVRPTSPRTPPLEVAAPAWRYTSAFRATRRAASRRLSLGNAGIQPKNEWYDRRSMDTVSLTIDGRQVTVDKGKTVLQAAIDNGVSVPYYCYHPGLGIDGSCRVCIVKIEKMPKLQTSCSTICTDGMIVGTRTPEVNAARAGIFEFLLINHPLDCPVCDKGGECPLQDFSYT